MMLVPVGREEDAEMGIILGPPDTRSLGLPEEVDVILHNNLCDRGLLVWDDVRKRPMEIIAALQAALSVNGTKITNMYREVRDAKHTESIG